ncbi:MAG: helix-turn-helix transcriptional regulator [Clostridia bacterium]|nr:helix-turn-helix transcriptional regulator [Clostridia bacterium]
MDVKYTKLLKVLIDKNMKKTDLISSAGITSNIVAKISKGEFISMDSLKKICLALNCEVSDLIELNFVENE